MATVKHIKLIINGEDVLLDLPLTPGSGAVIPYPIVEVTNGTLNDHTVNVGSTSEGDTAYSVAIPIHGTTTSNDFYLILDNTDNTSQVTVSLSPNSGQTQPVFVTSDGGSPSFKCAASKITTLHFTQIGSINYVVTGGENGGSTIPTPFTANNLVKIGNDGKIYDAGYRLEVRNGIPCIVQNS